MRPLDQQKIIEQILQKNLNFTFLPPNEEEGKSALAGLLANQLDTKIYLTAQIKVRSIFWLNFHKRDYLYCTRCAFPCFAK